MARADLLLSLVDAANRGDRVMLKRSIEALAAEERAKQHHVLADELSSRAERSPEVSTVHRLASVPQTDLWYERAPRVRLEDLVLEERVSSSVRELVEEQHRTDLLRAHGLEPRNRILLSGPPGNGKTTLAEAIAEALIVPMIVPRYESIVGSFLGETSQRLHQLFQHVASRRCVLFFDEFDTVGKERADEHETGEIKRVVSSLLMQIDDLPSYVVVVAATNHPELLDRAVWRRFQIRLEMRLPTPQQVSEWFRLFNRRYPIKLPTSEALLQRFRGNSYSDLEEFGLAVLRRAVLAGPDADLRSILRLELLNVKRATSNKQLTSNTLKPRSTLRRRP
jgi:SpoVK/Ycf46/Vps4 family AAA+-type ATPase